MGPQGQQPYYGQPYSVSPGYNQGLFPQATETGKICPKCNKRTQNIPTRTMGCASWCWVIWLTPALLCLLPCYCCEQCKDTNLVCAQCHTVKFTSRGDCC